MKSRRSRKPLGISLEAQEVLKATLEERAEGDCPTLEQLTRLAEGTLAGEARREVQAHLQQCPACASLAAKVWPQFALARALHEGRLAGRRETDERLQHVWQQHLQRCPACHQKVLERVWTGGRKRTVWQYATSFALGAAATAVILLTFTPQPPPEEIVSKDVPSTHAAPRDWMNAQEMLERFLHPSPEELPFVTYYWSEAAAQAPDDPAPLVKLQQLYGQQARQETDPQKREEWREKQKEVQERLRRLQEGSPRNR